MRGRGGRGLHQRRGWTAACAVVVAMVGSAFVPAVPAVAAAAGSSRGLSAFALLDAAGYESALGQPIQGVEDDGAIPSSSGLVSRARSVTTTGIELDVLLTSFATAAAAKQDYRTLTASRPGENGFTPIAGAGDAASYSPGRAFVLKKAQTLEVEARLGGDIQQKLDEIKKAGGDPTAAQTEALMTAAKLAPALATDMAGEAVKKPKPTLAKGAVDACAIDGALKAVPKLGTFTRSYELSERPPAMQCQYSLSTGFTIAVYVVTADQLAAAAPPTDLATVFARDRAVAERSGGAGRSVSRQSSPDLGHNIFTQEFSEPTAEILGSRCLVRVNMPGSQVPTRQVTDTDIRALERFLREAIRQDIRNRACRNDLQHAIGSGGDPFDEFKRDIDRLQNLSLAELLALAGIALLV